jgi:hypothetical protein
MNNPPQDIELVEPQGRAIRAEREQQPDANVEPRRVNMVRPFAEAEARERERRAKEERERVERAIRERAEKAREEQQLNARREQANATSDDSKKQASTSNVIPDQLNITIRTSIPGYQKIEYKPSMTIKDSDSKGVQFYPLIKLDKSKISKMPDEYKVKQFFNRGLFQSLLNYNGGTPAKNLNYATRAGYVDNNIKVTLDTIFPVNSVIYIGKQPYAIGDFQWTSGDWKLEVKQKKQEIDLSKIKNPQLYTQLVSEEIISGEQQLSELPQNLLVGNNYRGPPVATGIPAAVPSPAVPPPVATGIPATVPPPAVSQSTAVSQPTVPIPAAVPPQPPARRPQPVRQLLPPNQMPQDNNEDMQPMPIARPPLQPPQQLAIENEPYEPPVEDVDPREQQILDDYIASLNFNPPRINGPGYWTRNNFINFFIQRSFFNIADTVYQKLPNYLRQMLINFYRLVTQPKNTQAGTGQTIGVMYKELCKQCILINTPSNNDSFFLAVSNGINIYNYENESKKIIYNNIYGKTQLFTIRILRQIVWRYYESLTQEEKNNLITNAQTKAYDMNISFRYSLRQEPVDTDEMYIERLNDIYNNQTGNLLVYKPPRKPILVDEEESPFRVLRPIEIENYITNGDYIGDEFAIQAICSVLGIYIIPIEKYRSNDKTIKYKTIANYPNNRLPHCSRKILFLYKENLHYQTVVFNYKSQINVMLNQVQRNYAIKNTYYTIFNTIDEFPPPFHMLLVIYGSNYIYQPQEIKINYILSNILNSINNSVTKIINGNNKKFIEDFNLMFDVEDSHLGSIETYIRQNLGDADEAKDNEDNIIIGGDPPYGYPSYGYPSYGYPPYGYKQDSRAITTPQQQDVSKIAYAITIDMELHPGTSLTPKQINESICNSKYNAIRKAYSEFTGRPYVIPPVYRVTQTKKNVGGRPNRITRRKH